MKKWNIVREGHLEMDIDENGRKSNTQEIRLREINQKDKEKRIKSSETMKIDMKMKKNKKNKMKLKSNGEGTA